MKTPHEGRRETRGLLVAKDTETAVGGLPKDKRPQPHKKASSQGGRTLASSTGYILQVTLLLRPSEGGGADRHEESLSPGGLEEGSKKIRSP